MSISPIKTSSTRQSSLVQFIKQTPSKPRPSTLKRDIISSMSSDEQPSHSRTSKDLKHEEEEQADERPQKKPRHSSPYPPPDHPSYHLPPSPTYNHPFPISPVPQSLKDNLKFNTLPIAINSPHQLDLLYFKRFIDPCVTRELTRYLLEELPWYRVKYTVRGVNINTPRYTTVFGKDSTDKPWNGYKVKPRAIPEILLLLMREVEHVTNSTFNFALVNYYSSGTDSISYHSDSESFLGPEPTIASLSLGAPRDFHLRHVKYKELGIGVEKMVLHDGDMVVMRGKTQEMWQHAIPKRAKAEGRINITFRKGVVPYATVNYNTYNVGSGGIYRWDGREMKEMRSG
ncbi:hypothetical protein M231_07256 [Tremella mesenterica]|uniref:Fe2OG dioxygenase domain-containing protein n=1 Tax=Tremella mesenterica TaxID=5217 RepID=A0A4Q1B9L4_TREME|nr:hypothetical protein M231_07256 [Tremella mesenterica]